MKGLDFRSSQRESRELLKVFTLEKEKNLTVKELTFDAKRRLCLATALIGYSEILVLDEPNYGVDQKYRKCIWEILSKIKRKKTIIMATNSMEGADTLADRIAIIANSRIECYGSKAYLNKRYQIGYELSMVIKPGCNLQSLQDSIQQYSSELVSLTGKMGRMVKFKISPSSKLARLLSFLEGHKDELKISLISLHPSSIETQFRRIAFMSHFKERHVWFSNDKYEWIFQERRRKLIQEKKDWARNSGNALCRQQIAAILYKKILHVAASWNPYLFSIIFSMIALILTMTVSGLTRFPHIQTRQIKLNPEIYTSRNFFALVHSSNDIDSQKFFSAFKLTSQDFGMNDLHVSRNITATGLMIHPELHSISFRERYFMVIDILENRKINIMYSPVISHSSPIALNLLHNTMLRYHTQRDKLKINIKSRPLISPEHWQYYISHGKGIKNWENAVIITTLFLLLPCAELGVRETYSISKLLQLNTANMNALIYWIPTYIIDIIIFLLSLLITVVVSFISYHRMVIISLPFMLEMFSIFLCYGAAAIAMEYCLQLCIKNTGSAYFTILMTNLITALMINPDLLFPLIMHHINIEIQAYMEIFFHIFPPYVFSCAVGNFIAIKLYNQECSVDNKCDSEYAIEDPCCYNCGDEFCFKPLDSLVETNTESLFHHSVLNDMLLMISQTIFFYMILIICESNNRRKWNQSKIHGKTIRITDEDMLIEKKHIDTIIENYEKQACIPQEISVIVKGLSKDYNKKMAVRNINFRINKHECFGILGMNRTGKTTIFQALIGEIRSKIEKAWVCGAEYSVNDDEFFGMFGYCPQKGGLIDFLTGRQSLYFFAALRGVPWKYIREEVDRWLDIFDMLEFENLKLENCAWGVRRKMSVLQSLIGDLPVIFLDEPSSGMDIISRSALDETLCQLCEMGTSVFITTHSTDEAEALCNRVGILVGGYLITTGTCERLVEKQGNKYIITIMLRPQTTEAETEAIEKLVKSIISSANFIGRHLDILFYEFSRTFELEEVFAKLNVIKFKHSAIIDYFINQQSLEEVFQHISTAGSPLNQQYRTQRRSILQRISQMLNHFSPPNIAFI